ncbi:hypothetical protein PsorP6_017709 [Peronosclerospora sorghi]|uniref:Uncharacterized protein n=1 Tax=Peronosclerospora sorghi TaxID=230839 RepID=A0ACC0WNG2_9STRA|nr:hypothetical protein PsorP6_017709 [Peronosclerospora sorghi]
MASLPTIKDENQARHYGRVRAKNILHPMHWKRIGTLSDEAPRLFEIARSPAARASPDATTTYTLRATNPLDASIAEIEAVLTGHTALLKPHETSSSSSLLPRLLPATYVSGKTLALYPPLEISSTKERESVRIESARFKSYRLDKEPHRDPGARRDTVEEYNILGYTLSTQLQRSNAKKCSKHGTASVLSVPSVLHLYRPVRAASAGADRRHDVTWTPPTRSTRSNDSLRTQARGLTQARTFRAAAIIVSSAVAERPDWSSEITRSHMLYCSHDVHCNDETTMLANRFVKIENSRMTTRVHKVRNIAGVTSPRSNSTSASLRLMCLESSGLSMLADKNGHTTSAVTLTASNSSSAVTSAISLSKREQTCARALSIC